jgi:molybdenum cofactor biosynthesis enzyme MoaA
VTACRSKLPQVDIHTNGLLLVQGDRLKKLVDWGLNMVTFSIASFDADKNKQIMGVRQPVQTLINTANQLDILVRCSLLLTKKTAHNPATIIEYVRQARELGADMVVCRELWLPACPNDDSEEIQSWVKANHVNMKRLEQAFLKASKGEVQYDLPIRLIRLLPWGARVYDVGGVNVSFAHCDERFNNGTYKSIQLVPRTKPWGAINWRIQGSWDSTGDVLG